MLKFQNLKPNIKAGTKKMVEEPLKSRVWIGINDVIYIYIEYNSENMEYGCSRHFVSGIIQPPISPI